jgi:hypothetical protein
MRINFLLFLSVLFPVTTLATQDYTMNVKHIQIEGVKGEKFEISTNKDGSRIERIDAILPIGKFSIPSKYLKDAKEPDLTSLSVMLNPGGARVEAGADGEVKTHRWGAYYVVKFHFYGDGSGPHYVEAAAPEVEMIFRETDEPEINIIENYLCPKHMTEYGCQKRVNVKVKGIRIIEK